MRREVVGRPDGAPGRGDRGKPVRADAGLGSPRRPDVVADEQRDVVARGEGRQDHRAVAGDAGADRRERREPGETHLDGWRSSSRRPLETRLETSPSRLAQCRRFAAPAQGAAEPCQSPGARIAWGGFGRCVAPSNAHRIPGTPRGRLVRPRSHPDRRRRLRCRQPLSVAVPRSQQAVGREIRALRVRHARGRRRPRAHVGQVLPRGDGLPAVRHRGRLPLSLGPGHPRPALGRA